MFAPSISPSLVVTVSVIVTLNITCCATANVRTSPTFNPRLGLEISSAPPAVYLPCASLAKNSVVLPCFPNRVP